MPIMLTLNRQGFTNDEIADAVQDMAENGLVEGSNSGKFIALTDAGFAVM